MEKKYIYNLQHFKLERLIQDNFPRRKMKIKEQTSFFFLVSIFSFSFLLNLFFSKSKIKIRDI